MLVVFFAFDDVFRRSVALPDVVFKWVAVVFCD